MQGKNSSSFISIIKRMFFNQIYPDNSSFTVDIWIENFSENLLFRLFNNHLKTVWISNANRFIRRIFTNNHDIDFDNILAVRYLIYPPILSKAHRIGSWLFLVPYQNQILAQLYE